MVRPGPHREGEESKPMMHERGKSDSAVVATKPANKAERSAAELVEQRAGTKGNADQQSTRRAQYRESVSQALGRIRQISPSITRGRRSYGRGAAEVVAPSSSIRTDGGYPWPKSMISAEA